MSFKGSLIVALALGAGALGCHSDRDANMAGSARPLAPGGTAAMAADYRDPSTPGPIGGDHAASSMSGGQVVDPADPAGMATDAGVRGMPDASGGGSGGVMRDAGTGGGGMMRDAGTGGGGMMRDAGN